MSQQLNFKIDFIDGQNVEGQATRVFVKDMFNVLTISNDHAPIITLIQKGLVQVFANENAPLHTFEFEEGFLTCKDNVCKIHILK